MTRSAPIRRPSLRMPFSGMVVLSSLLLVLACSDDGTNPGGASGMAFAVPPTSVGIGTRISPPVTVAIRDLDGNTAADWTDPVTLSLEGDQSGTDLLGTVTQTPLAGLAIFTDLEVSGTGTGFRLIARSGDLEPVESEAFDVHDILRADQISAGYEFTCALDPSGVAYCFGSNTAGQLGTGDFVNRTLPSQVQTQERFLSISAMGRHVCALSLESEVFCWGSNLQGEGGIGTTDPIETPRKVELPGPAESADAGYYHACALLDTGEAYCWGDNFGGALGIGVADSIRTSPVRVTGDHEWALIETGYLQTCGLTTGGTAYCWGPNIYGANGDGTRSDARPSPTPVIGGHTFSDLVAGGGPCHGETCGVTTEGQVLCWGKNYQRHVVSSDISWMEPTAIQEDPGWVDVFVGPGMICGHDPDGDLYCLGDAEFGIMEFTAFPQPMVPGLDVSVISQGNTHVCVLTQGGEVRCWGSDLFGQLGSGGVSTGWTEPRPAWGPPAG